MAAATIMMVTYGHQVISADDEFVALAEAVREYSERTPARNLVDVIPLRTCFGPSACMNIRFILRA